MPADWRPRPYELISENEHDIRGMRTAEKNPRHIIIADWNDQPMDMYLIRFRDTGYIPACSNSLTLNGRGGTRCESTQDLTDAGGTGRNERGCLLQEVGHEYTNVEHCSETHPELEVVQVEPGAEWVWINFIHSGAHHSLAISIDEHEFWVVAADGEFVHPQKVVRTHVNLGERIRLVFRPRVRNLITSGLISGAPLSRQHSGQIGQASRRLCSEATFSSLRSDHPRCRNSTISSSRNKGMTPFTGDVDDDQVIYMAEDN